MLVRESWKGGVLRVTEMLPPADALWLPDAEGSRYTCEFRMCAVDLHTHV